MAKASKRVSKKVSLSKRLTKVITSKGKGPLKKALKKASKKAAPKKAREGMLVKSFPEGVLVRMIRKGTSPYYAILGKRDVKITGSKVVLL